MTRTQRICIVIGMAILAAMWLFPPWLYCAGFFGGYSFVLYPGFGCDRIDFGRLVAQNVVVGVLTITAFLAARSSKPTSRKSPPHEVDAGDPQVDAKPPAYSPVMPVTPQLRPSASEHPASETPIKPSLSPASSGLYYTYRNAQQAGPYTFGQIQSMWRFGSLDAATLYFTAGMADWKPLLDLVPHLDNSAPSPPETPIVQPPTPTKQGVKKRPTSVTVIAWILLVTSGLFLLTSSMALNNPMAQELMAKSPIPIPLQYIILYAGLTISIVCAIFILQGANWARLLYVVWGGVGLLIGLRITLFTSPELTTAWLPGILKYVIFVFFLLRPKASAYFTQSANVSTQPAVETATIIRKCPHCGVPYKPADYDPKGLWFCASCEEQLPNERS